MVVGKSEACVDLDYFGAYVTPINRSLIYLSAHPFLGLTLDIYVFHRFSLPFSLRTPMYTIYWLVVPLTRVAIMRLEYRICRVYVGTREVGCIARHLSVVYTE
ncbi:hypothetical protein OPQ81_000461 [Rhizoctonia solani]|nr:hypothetical protein OPQ81_000461 [Rhizoctonia solani]